MFKKDTLQSGLALGFAGPLLSLVIYYFAKFFPLYSVMDVLHFMAREKNQITAISVTCLLLNIALFTFYVNTNRDQTAKGIFSVTLVYAIGALLLKFLL